MNDPRRLRARNFPSAQDEVEAAQPHSPYDRPGSSFRMAFADSDFLLRDELRPVRLQLELLKPELAQQAHKIHSTIVVYGSARTLPPDEAARRLAAAEAQVASGTDPTAAQQLKRARMQLEQSHYYEVAREFSRLVSACSQNARRLPGRRRSPSISGRERPVTSPSLAERNWTSTAIALASTSTQIRRYPYLAPAVRFAATFPGST